MAYKKHEWKARQGTGLNKFRDQNGKLYEFTSAPDSVTQPGTPFSADWMNEMEEGIAAAGITYLISTAASNATSVTITDNAPETVAAGDHFRIYFPNQVGADATLNIGNTGAKPIINNYTASAIVQGDIPADYTADIMYDGTDYVLLNALAVSGTPTGYAFFTADGDFTVPNFVNTIKVSACAAGVGRYAGEYIVDQIFNVTPGQDIALTIGSGNTVIGDLATLIAGTVSSATPTTKLGYAAGYNGGTGAGDSAKQGAGGYGGAFGYGGGGAGGQITSISGVSRGGGGAGGAGMGGAGATPTSYGAEEGAGGGSTGGAGGSGNSSNNTSRVASNGADSTSGKIVYKGATVGNGTTGGGGSIYGAGGGGGANYKTKTAGGGGAAGGYGAGGGVSGDGSTVTGDPSSGMVLIEWGGSTGSQTDVSTLTSAIARNATDIASNSSEINLLQADVDTLENDVSQNTQDILYLKSSGGSSSEGNLPNGYVPLEYIGATGTQYIDTGVIADQDTRLICRVICIASDDTNWVYGSRFSSSARLFTFAASSSGYYNASYGSTRLSYSTDVNSNDYITIYHNKNVITINGENAQTATVSTFTTPGNLILFGCNTNGTIASASTTIAKYFRIYDGNTLIRDYAPCISPDGEYGMYDKVNGRFYGNSGTGSFIGA